MKEEIKQQIAKLRLKLQEQNELLEKARKSLEIANKKLNKR